jgi:hypothetical protein
MIKKITIATVGKNIFIIAKKRWYAPSIALLICFAQNAKAQSTIPVTVDAFHKEVIPGKEYGRSGLHDFFFGKHYRKEWTTSVNVPVLNLDSAFGGLTPTEQGGGRQTKTLRLKDKNGKQYVLRSIDKSFTAALPEEFRGSFLEGIANDQVSIAHPFAPITVPILAEAAGIFHTNPVIVFVPESGRLGAFNKDFANTLCLLEERPDDDQTDAPNFGHSRDVVGTEKMFEKLYNGHGHRVDQVAFVKARLFDIFLGDWGRHEDQWRWAKFDSANATIYKPIPRDRDQAFSKFDGLVPHIATGPEDLEHLRSFDYKIKNIKKYNFPARYLDRQLTNEVPLQTWIDLARGLQASLTDATIEAAIHQLPPELFSISGNELIAKLKARRNDLVKYAGKYYKFLNEEVELVGTKEADLFDVERLDKGETKISIYAIDKNGAIGTNPFYTRTFNRDETKEIRIFGLEGADVYNLHGNTEKAIDIRIIGSKDTDILNEQSHVVKGGHNTKFYDNELHIIKNAGEAKLFISSDTAINTYNYRGYKSNSGSKILSPSYSNMDEVFISLGYTYTKQHWRKTPFNWQQTAKLNFSLMQLSFSADYYGFFNELIGKWSLVLNGRYDQENQYNYFGTGNESKNIIKTPRYYRIQTDEGLGSVGLNRHFLKNNSITFSAFYNSVKVLKDKEKFVTDVLPATDPTLFNRKNFGGVQADYIFNKTNNRVIPTKGFNFIASAAYTKNLKDKDRSFTRLTGTATGYIPLTPKFSLALRAGGATVDGETEFYQKAWLGGGQNLKGFRRQRFYGKSAFYNSNELRWITNMNGYILKGKFGLIGFLDNGRVWEPTDISDEWHVGYGGGFMIAPFSKLSLSIFYGVSKDDALFHLRFSKEF